MNIILYYIKVGRSGKDYYCIDFIYVYSPRTYASTDDVILLAYHSIM
jgi:hypothetical protein